MDCARAAGPVLFPEAHPDVAFIRCGFALVGHGAPAEDLLPTFLQELYRSRWAAFPPLLDRPRSGDLYVRVGADGTGEEAGFVQRVHDTDGWFYGLNSGPERVRLNLGQVDFFLRAPST